MGHVSIASGFNLQQTMVWDALGQSGGGGDTLQWGESRRGRGESPRRSCLADFNHLGTLADEGMHWMLDDATRYLSSITADPSGQQNAPFGFGDFASQPLAFSDGDAVGLADAPMFQAGDDTVDSAMLSYFLSEIQQLRPSNAVGSSSLPDRQHQDTYAAGQARNLGAISPAPGGGSGRLGSTSVTRANSPRAGFYSRAGSVPAEETAEDRWRK